MMNLIILNVLYTVLNKMSNILNYIFGQPVFDNKEVKEIKKSPSLGWALDNFLKFINSRAGVRLSY